MRGRSHVRRDSPKSGATVAFAQPTAGFCMSGFFSVSDDFGAFLPVDHHELVAGTTNY